MTTAVANGEIDSERIFKIWELPHGAKVQIHYVREEKGKEPEEGDCVAVFQYVDGAYGLWYDEKTGEPLIFNGMFKQIDQDCFYMLTKEEEEALNKE